MTSQTPPSQMTCEADFPDPNDRACNLAPRWKKGPWGHVSHSISSQFTSQILSVI